MMEMRLRMQMKQRQRLGMRIRELNEMPDAEFKARLRRIEKHPLFDKLLQHGVISVHKHPRPRSLPGTLSHGVGASTTLTEDIQHLIQRIGQEKFTDCFLSEAEYSDQDRARICGVSEAEVGQIRFAVDQAYIQQEFAEPGREAQQSQGDGTRRDRANAGLIGGIEIVDGRPKLTFFHRDVWTACYRINERLRCDLLAASPFSDAMQINSLLNQLAFVNKRTTNLYKAIQVLINFQAEYLQSEDSARLSPLTLRELARKVATDHGSLARLLRGKSLQLVSGREIPLLSLIPGRKAVMQDRLVRVFEQNSTHRDKDAARELWSTFGRKVSRRSVALYRKELDLPSIWSRLRTD